MFPNCSKFHPPKLSLFICVFPSYFLDFSYKIFVNKVKKMLQDVISREALEHVVTEYKVGGYSFKIMRANGDKQPTDSLKSRFQT